MNKREYKKRYLICKDDDGKNIYMGDIVEVFMPMETSKPHQSRVHWNPLDGAFIDSHPAHVKMGLGSRHRSLRGYLNQSPITMYNENDEKVTKKGYCRKVKSVFVE